MMILGSVYYVRQLDQIVYFYKTILGMTVFELGHDQGRQIAKLGYSDRCASLYFIESPNTEYVEFSYPGYWKIGITINDIQTKSAQI